MESNFFTELFFQDGRKQTVKRRYNLVKKYKLMNSHPVEVGIVR